jgi:hypothetical protein
VPRAKLGHLPSQNTERSAASSLRQPRTNASKRRVHRSRLEETVFRYDTLPTFFLTRS